MMDSEYITIMEAARAAGEPRSSIQNLANRGQVRVQATDAPNPRRGGRLVHRADVLAWFDPAQAGQWLGNSGRTKRAKTR